MTSMRETIAKNTKIAREHQISQKMRDMDLEALRSVMSTPQGRWLMSRLLGRTHIYDPLCRERLLEDEAVRNIGLDYLRDLSSLGLEGVKLKQQAEQEYAATRLQLELEFERTY